MSSGYVDEAKQHLHQAFDEAQPGEDGFFRPELHRLQGDFLLAMDPGDTEPAEACHERAATIARKQGAKMLELRAAMSLSRLLQKQGRGKQACGRLTEVYAGFTEGLDAPDLKEAKLLLEELS